MPEITLHLASERTGSQSRHDSRDRRDQMLS